MIKFFLAVVCCCRVWLVAAQREQLPAELKPFVPKGYDWLDYAKEDLNRDGKPDYILILKTPGEDTLTFDNPNWDAGRPLLLIVTRPSGELKLAVRNDEVIMCRHCGGAMGDPYDGISTKPGEFSVSFYGGSSWRWTEGYTFRHDPVKKNWFLEEYASSSFQAADPETNTSEMTARRAETGDITLEKFNTRFNLDTLQWKVTVAKTWFYPSPDKKEKPGKAFLLKGDVVKGFRRYTNFLECTFTNKKGVVTSGFILRAHLMALKKVH